MTEGMKRSTADQISASTEDTPATSAKESNETDIQMKSEKAAFREEQSALE
ncbi:hypothetical protein ACFFK0_03150 [Paenibacillus chartarius]|uniref:YfhD family protein n=1 Tax=Paenibacillus chartarius TaxID=747481 RepID=A0ABV6DFN2_9BACL